MREILRLLLLGQMEKENILKINELNKTLEIKQNN